MARHQREDNASRSRRVGARGTIRRRLASILAFPIVAVVGLLAIVVTNDLNAYRSAEATVNAVELTLGVQQLVEELQHERGLANNVLGGDVSFASELPRARALVDEQFNRLGALAGDDSTDAQAVQAAFVELDTLASVRAQVDAGELIRSEAFDYFTDRIAALSDIGLGLESSTDPALRRGVAALQALGEVKETTAQMRAFLSGVFAAGGFSLDEYSQYATIRAGQQAAMERYFRFADPHQADLLVLALDTGAAREARFFEDRALAAVNRPFVVSPQSWWSSHTTIIDDMRLAQESVGDDIAVRAGELRNRAAIRLGVLGGLALLSLVGAFIIVVMAARSITGPLALLAGEARAMATQRLPDAVRRLQGQQDDEPPPAPAAVAVPARSTVEIVDVVEALNSAQFTAYSLATEQAILRRSTTESLANLGRRNQNLLRRQLGFITQLERDEADPAGLANLFELDHLATRMRRNAESLLILVGESSPRSWSDPLPVGDVLRAAVSEVEDYRRVTLRRIGDAFVAGNAVAGIAHMIAELVENGLAFSPPDTDVEIQGRLLAGRYVIGITDQGIGMDADDLAQANARLRGEESFLSAPTRYLGHYVVGHLARQLGVQVELTPSPVTGVTARVTLPESVLAATAAITEGGQAGPTPGPTRAIASAPRVEYLTAVGSSPPIIPPASPSPLETATPASSETVSQPAPAVASAEPELSEPDTPSAPAPAASPVVVSVKRVGNDVATHVAHGGGERTRNGLLKRVSRVRSAPPARGSGGGAEPQPDRSAAAAPPEVHAAQLRSSLTSLRAGVSRGEQSRGRDDNAGSKDDG